MKASAKANSNIALVKYWGKLDPEIRVPANSSISMTKTKLETHTTVEFSDDYEEDLVKIDGEEVNGRSRKRVVDHLDRIREMKGEDKKAKVSSKNNFPTAAGLASSASGFAALTMAAVEALEMNLSKKELSKIARMGSGSATRSIHGGFVKWNMGGSHDESYAEQIADRDHFSDLRALVAIIKETSKEVSSTKGHSLVKDNPFFDARLAQTHEDLSKVEAAVKEEDFTKLGKYAERNAISMHATMITSEPPLFYMEPGTIKVIKSILNWRQSGELECYFTEDAGPNVHVFCREKDMENLKSRLKEIEEVEKTITVEPGPGARIVEKDLF